jgi:hypothetical protein
MKLIEVNLEICTLFKGEPTGLAIIHYVDPKNTMKSFKGIGIFNKGKLHNSPFICHNDEEKGFQFSKMINGIRAENFYYTHFKPKNSF